jgi:hypothetical protein
MNSIVQKLNATIQAASKYAHKRGEAERSEVRKEWSLIHAAAFLNRCNGVIDWVGKEKCPFGYNTIWEYCAGEYFGADKKPNQKAAAVLEREVEMKNGFNRLRERLLEEWGMVLLMVPRKVDDQRIVVITLNNDYVVNLSGQTASEIQLEKDSKLLRGQVKSSFNRTARLLGVDETKQSIDCMLETLCSQDIPAPTGNQLCSPSLFDGLDLLQYEKQAA